MRPGLPLCAGALLPRQRPAYVFGQHGIGPGQALLQGVPVIVLDPKGDMGNLMLTFPALDGPSFAPWVPESDVQRAAKSRDEVGAEVATQWREGLAGWGIDGTRIRALREAAGITIYTPGSTVGVPLDIIGNLRAPAAGGDAELLQDEIEGLVSSLLGLVGVVADEEAPAERRVLRGEGVEGRHLVVFRQPCAGLGGVAAGLDQDDPTAALGKARRKRPAAGAGADDDIVAIGVRRRRQGGLRTS